jgi:hypothetical protein
MHSGFGKHCAAAGEPRFDKSRVCTSKHRLNTGAIAALDSLTFIAVCIIINCNSFTMLSLSSRLPGLGMAAPAETETERECSLLLCGLPTSVALASSSFFKWKSRHGLDDMVHEEAMMDLTQVPGSSTCPITMFRYSAPKDPHPAAIRESLKFHYV